MYIVCIFISIRETTVMQEIDRAREIEIGIKEEKGCRAGEKAKATRKRVERNNKNKTKRTKKQR